MWRVDRPIVLDIRPEAEELDFLRWELLRDPGNDRLLANSEKIYFSRYLGSQDPSRINLPDRHELRALLAVSAPSDLGPNKKYPLAEVRIQEELERARKALQGTGALQGIGQIEILGTDHPVTPENLRDRIGDGIDLVYLVCHGAMIKNSPRLYLQHEDRTTQVVEGKELSRGIGSLAHQPVLMVLASCHSGGDGRASSAQNSLARMLTRAGVPAVLSMRGSISMDTVEKGPALGIGTKARDAVGRNSCGSLVPALSL